MEFIEETIRSVLLQGYPNLEYIVMDGGSTDGTLAILERYRPFFHYMRIAADEGQAAAIADGFEHATGEIIAWLNSDDIYEPQALFRVGRFFATHSQCVLVSGDVDLMNSESQLSGILHAVPTQLFLSLNTGGHGWWQPGVFWKRHAYTLRAVVWTARYSSAWTWIYSFVYAQAESRDAYAASRLPPFAYMGNKKPNPHRGL